MCLQAGLRQPVRPCCASLHCLQPHCISDWCSYVDTIVTVRVTGGQAAVEGLQGQDSLSVDFNAEEAASPRTPTSAPGKRFIFDLSLMQVLLVLTIALCETGMLREQALMNMTFAWDSTTSALFEEAMLLGQLSSWRK